jgi:hypothetical protein
MPPSIPLGLPQTFQPSQRTTVSAQPTQSTESTQKPSTTQTHPPLLHNNPPSHLPQIQAEPPQSWIMIPGWKLCGPCIRTWTNFPAHLPTQSGFSRSISSSSILYHTPLNLNKSQKKFNDFWKSIISETSRIFTEMCSVFWPTKSKKQQTA